MAKFSIRKFLIAMLLIVLAISLTFTVACKFNRGNSGDESPTATDDNPTPPPALKSIKVTKQPDKVEYYSFELFDPSGMEVTAIYTDKSEKLIDLADLEYPNGQSLAPGATQVEIYYNGKATAVEVSVQNRAFEDEVNLWIEAENANVQGYTSEKNPTNPEVSCNNIKYNVEGAHNNACLYNISNTGNLVSFSFTSDKEMVGGLQISIAARKKASAVISDWFTIEVNGDKVTSEDNIGSAEDLTDYFTFYVVSMNIRIKEGENTVVLTVISTPGNVDAIGIIAPGANLTDTTVPSLIHNDPGWRIKTVPTDATEGLLVKGCTICGNYGMETKTLPVLNDQDYTIETVKEPTEEENGIDKYTYVLDENNSVSFEVTTYYVALPTNVYTLEAESAYLQGVSASGDNKDKALDCRNIRTLQYCIDNVSGFDPSTTFSGNEIVFAINKQNNTVTFVVNSDMSAEALLNVCVSVRISSGKSVEVKFSNMFTVTVNDVVLEVPDSVKVTPNVIGSSNAYEFHTVSVGTIQLEKGENQIVLKVPSAQQAGNFDFIQLTTVATLENKSTAMAHGQTGWVLTETPTEANTGLLEKGCLTCNRIATGDDAGSYVLPVISKTEAFYQGTGVNYIATVDGQEFSFIGPDRDAALTFTGEHRWLGGYEATKTDGTLVSFYDESSWAGTKPTVQEDGSLKFEALGRIDRQLNVKEDEASYLPSHNEASHDAIKEKPIVYSMMLKSSGSFNILLFAGSNATATNSGSGKYSLQLNYNAETKQFSWTRRTSSSPTVGTVSSPTSFSAEDWNTVDIVITRHVTGEEDSAVRTFTVDLYLNGTLVKFTRATTASSSDDFVNENGSSEFKVSKNLTGGYMAFIGTADTPLYVKTPADSHYQPTTDESEETEEN